MELVDTYGSEPYAARHEGSNPSLPTNLEVRNWKLEVREIDSSHFYFPTSYLPSLTSKFGLVAQLVERGNRNAEARGSIPLESTTPTDVGETQNSKLKIQSKFKFYKFDI